MPPTSTDLSHLDRQFRGDRALARQWMALYLDEAPALFARLREAQAAGDAAGMAHAVHDLCPQAQYLAAERLLYVLRAVETCAHAGGPAACNDLMDELDVLAKEVEAELRTALAG